MQRVVATDLPTVGAVRPPPADDLLRPPGLHRVVTHAGRLPWLAGQALLHHRAAATRLTDERANGRKSPAMTSPSQPSDAVSAPERSWADALAALAIPDEILDAAPVSPHGFDVSMFRRAAARAEAEETPSQRVAREALPQGGCVLDVGCGGGAGAMPLVPPAGRVVGVDEGAGMLEAFAERAEERGVAHAEIQGRWPDVAAQVPTADVVVCHNVFYNVPDIGPFAQALTDHARARVVVELGAEHPLAWLAPYWKHFHDLDRPSRPTAEDAIAAVRSLGYDVRAEHWTRSWRSDQSEEELVAQVRQRLCLGSERDEEIAEFVRRHPPPSPRPLVTLWWAPPVA